MMPPVTPLALPSAYLALQGDDRGEAALRRMLGVPKSVEAMPAVALAAAAGLRRLGDPEPWTETVSTLRGLGDEALVAGDLDGARRFVAALTLVRPVVVEGASIRLGDLDRRADRLARDLESELPTADALRTRLAELTD